MSKEFEKFYGTLVKVGDSLMVTVPSKMVKFAGFEKDMPVKVMIQKHSIFEEE